MNELKVAKDVARLAEILTSGNEAVNHPAHYSIGGIEVIDAITAWGFGEGFNRGNAIKYIARAGRKNPETELEDLRKARWYIDAEIKRIEREDGK